MIFRVTIPELSMGSTAARVSAWYKEPGDEIAFGDTICELKVREWKTVHRTKDASRLTRRRRKQAAEEAGTRYATMVCKTCRERPELAGTGDCPDCMRYHLIASEAGTLSSHEAAVGEDVPVGGVIALVKTQHEAPPGVDVQPAMRVIADMVDRTESAS